MKNFFLQILTWWNGQTIGTKIFTWRFGKRVGQDQFGNIYYEGHKSSYGLPHRWVIYKGYADPSSIPPEWHGWIHHRSDIPLAQDKSNVLSWQKPHHINYTGSPHAYRPKYSQNLENKNFQATGDYNSWTPDA
ncbi:NADH:ubiquinone oxidoreductase 17.2 kD subunit [Liberibacter crescens BT-1]|uniref:NADH:ubiquinone oxidoreductase 17.2 kD subunit n=1 Tax=Liberibacter crescens (strain BT-1) TaxID=1215343 RepID=L0EUJ8_LIBCB|nr:NADH:ubiquinone oxidoreductase subunit NDUFA12 [Liberibacter crescens]AGA64348.1 NADH:ubiquinone oxidoreductase 17.2 kD subunit [Liberibacter crescens BT-1]AMC12548.1 NADH dehydrogenase [Liberibacter crescens]